MSVFHNNILGGAAGQTGGAAAVEGPTKSLRFNSGDSAYLNRTPSSAGNRRKWTWAGWIKRSKLGAEDGVFSSYGTAHPNTAFVFNQDNTFQFHDFASGSFNFKLVSNRVLRDTSAWYHIIVAVDTTQSIAAYRIRIYINGTILSSSDYSTAQWPSENFETDLNSATRTDVGHHAGVYFNGYMADIHFIDGQQLSNTDFGEFDSNGIWRPKEASFTSPNNETTWSSGTQSNPDTTRPLLNLFDGSTSTLIAAASGNNASNKVTLPASITAQTSVRFYSGAGGYDNGPVTLSNSGTTVSTIAAESSQASGWKSFTGTFPMTFNEFTVNRSAGGTGSGAALLEVDGVILIDGAGTYGKNGFHLNFSDSSTNEALGYDSAVTVPDLNPKEGMDVLTWTGNGSTQNIGGLQFEPGLVWIKERGGTKDHNLYDSIRGATKELFPNGTGIENTLTNGLTSFNPDGFTLGSADRANGSSQTYVGWCWRAGGPAVSNTDGTTTSQVSANTDYGFSIVTYTGGTSDATIGHGLGQTPKFYIAKARTNSGLSLINNLTLPTSELV